MTRDLPFVAFYCRSLQYLIPQVTDSALRTFLALATYANEIGECWPGPAELSLKTGLSERSILEALDELVTKGLIVRLVDSETDPRLRKMLKNNVRISGEVLRIKVANQNQNQIQEPKESNQIQKPPTTSTKSRFSQEDGNESAGTVSSMYSANERFKHTDPSTKINTTEPARSAASDNVAHRTPTPPLPPSPPKNGALGDLAAYREPLASHDEALANEVYHAIPQLAIAEARRLVKTYGEKRIRTALIHYGRQQPNSIHSPGGYFKWLLNQSGLVPEKDGAQKERHAWSEGEFSDFIEH